MLEKTQADVEAQARERIELALGQAEALLDGEVDRLQRLAKVNPAVRADEITGLQDERCALLTVLPQARPRLDALRLIVSPDFMALRSA
ncbi:MAG: RNA polymerase-associated protein RapA [Alphaproteobacteria bacterium ADurb.BinA280]|nr:MAG: RNA polymerase-associated protein RapA [Alphaproteobacteria bacterium ADurb.BinA280]